MQDSFVSRGIAFLLAISLSLSLSVHRAKAVTVSGAIAVATTVVTFAELAYRVGKLGLDCWQLYKDLQSPDDYAAAESSYVAGLDSSRVSSSAAWTFLPTGWRMESTGYFNQSAMSDDSGGYRVNGIALASGTAALFWVYSDTFSLLPGAYALFFEGVSLCRHSGYSDRCDEVVLYGSYDMESWYQICYTGYRTSYDRHSSEVAATYQSSVNFSVSSAPYTYYRLGFHQTGSFSVGLKYDFYLHCHLECLEFAGANPYSSDPTSRPSSLMQTINNYNIDNSYTDNSTTVNYYIGTVDSAGTVTNTYNPAVYDETTLIYTDPVTDTQYLTTGWTYDYTTRRYSLTMAEDAYTIGKTAVATIDLTYGDDGVTIAHYDSAGTLLQEDAYAYVVAAPIEPGSCDHEFLWTVTTPATCTAAGERTGTCSICGGVMRQAIPAAAHAYAYTTTAEATCTSAGERTGECAVCHATVTEAVPALGHDWRKVKDVDTVFNEDGTVQEYSHTLYECARCKEQAESYDGDAPPPAEDETPSDGFSLSSWLMDFRSWFESALSALADKLSGSSLDQDSSDVYDGLKSQDEAASDSSPGWSFFGFLSSAVQGGTKLIRTVSGFFSGLFSDLGESLDGFTNAYSTTDPDSAFALFTSFDEEVAPDVPAS